MLKSVECTRVFSRPTQTARRPPSSAKIRCSMRAPHESTTSKAPRATRAVTLEASASNTTQKSVAQEFDHCYINFDKLGDEDAVYCVSVADEVLNECEAVSGGETCAEQEHVEWFKGYMSNAYGV